MITGPGGRGVPDIGTMQNKLLAMCRNEYYADSTQRIFSQVSTATPFSIRPIFLLIKFFFPFVVHFPLFLSCLRTLCNTICHATAIMPLPCHLLPLYAIAMSLATAICHCHAMLIHAMCYCHAMLIHAMCYCHAMLLCAIMPSPRYAITGYTTLCFAIL